MAQGISNLSRPMQIGILGSCAAIGAHGAKFAFEADNYLSSTVGGAISAIVANSLLSMKFEGVASIAMLGAIAGYTGNVMSNRLRDGLGVDGDIPFRALLGLVLGGGVGALSFDSLSPPEIKLLKP